MSKVYTLTDEHRAQFRPWAERWIAKPLDGPIIRSAHPMTINHPEHGTVTIPPSTYGIHYQRQYADKMRRVAD